MQLVKTSLSETIPRGGYSTSSHYSENDEPPCRLCYPSPQDRQPRQRQHEIEDLPQRLGSQCDQCPMIQCPIQCDFQECRFRHYSCSRPVLPSPPPRQQQHQHQQSQQPPLSPQEKCHLPPLLCPSSQRQCIPLPPLRRSSAATTISSGSSLSSGSSSLTGEAPEVVPPTGPISCPYTIPPRPRPGRKPIQHERGTDAADRRRVQNRVAQRNFRDKRQARLVEALAELERVREAARRENGELRRELGRREGELREKERVILELRRGVGRG